MVAVLVVDDMAAIRALVRVYLMAFKFEFFEATNGLEALESARAKPPDLIITDIQMPVMGGLELLQQIRLDSRLRSVPIIVLSSDEQQTRALGLIHLADTFVALKPIVPDALKSVVRLALKLA